MIYDIIAIINFSLCVFSMYIIIAILSRGRKKIYEPPEIKRSYLTGLVGFLAIPSVSLGAIIRVVTLGYHKDSLFAIFGSLACIAMVVTALEFLSFSKKESITIKNALPTGTNNI